VNGIRNVRMSDVEIDKAIDEVTIASGILKRDTVCGTKTSVKLDRSVHRAVISKTGTVKKIINVLSLGEVVAVRCGCDLNPKKVAKRAQVGHMKLLMETSLNKGNVLRIIPCDEHIIHIEKNKSTTMGEV
jgi:ABC-type hemin transport system substrate-binding protein